MTSDQPPTTGDLRLGCMSSRITELAVAAINTATAKCKKRAVRATGEIALWEPKR